METFEEFLTNSQVKIPLLGFLLNFILSAILGLALRWLYIKFGNSLSNRKQFSRNFLLLAMITMLIITIVKSSLALSLGLVGALSIVRFRAAIKEPEELIYLFLAIAIGLGLGADQAIVTIVALAIIAIIIMFESKYSNKFQDNQNLHLTIQSKGIHTLKIEDILEILQKNCNAVELRRFDEAPKMLEASFLIEALEFSQISKATEDLKKLNENLVITFLDNKGLS